ncbi:MAG: NAD(P)H-hydrate dehydratase [Acidiferrobacterales bacterium]|nr:NAD(P)H-hydrate dehydratase [Acidiferrobacterales bacterium]
MHPLPIHSTQQSIEIEDLVRRDYGISGYELMQRAGRGAFAKLRELWPQCRKIAVLCGSGNNGGDGYVFASEALDAGMDVEVRFTNEPKTTQARTAKEKFQDRGGKLAPDRLDSGCSEFDVVIDALLGIGLNKKITGRMADAVNVVNRTSKRVMSLDVPTGVDSDSGALVGPAVVAGATVTFISPKLGLFCLPASEHVGRLYIDTLDVPKDAYGKVGNVASLVDPNEFGPRIPIRKRAAYKNSVGQVLIIGGSESMEGAALMAAQAAYRSGAGLVSIATLGGGTSLVPLHSVEVRIHNVAETSDLERLIEIHDVIGIGPGLGLSDLARKSVEIVGKSDKRIVVDADGLTALAGTGLASDNWILTPHLGEAARLLGTTTDMIRTERLNTASKIVERYGGVCVLKGQNTVISTNEENWICMRGNPGMATAGMGDVLTGVICGIWGAGTNMAVAARAGVWIHAVAGDESAADQGQVGLMATDLLPGIRRAVNHVLDDA